MRREWIAILMIIPMALVPIQWMTTGHLLYARNYFYLIPVIVMAGVTVLWKQTSKWETVMAGVVAFILMIGARGPLGVRPAEKMAAMLPDVPADVGVIVGCCDDVVVKYLAGDSPALDWRQKTKWWIVVSSEDLPSVLSRNGLSGAVCKVREIATDYTVYECEEQR